VWIGGSDSCPVPTAVTALVEAADRAQGVAVASPEAPGAHAAVPAELLRRSLPEDDDTDPVPDLVRRARAEGTPVVACADAGNVKERVRRKAPQLGGALVGPATYAGKNTLVQTYTARDQVELGGYCSIADEVRIVLPGGRLFDDEGNEVHVAERGNHRADGASSFPIGILVPDVPYPQPPKGLTGERLVLGDDVWLGYGAMILGGVTVGTGSIVGARAVVVDDVPPYSVVAGVPARVLRKRFEDDVAARLMRVGWWDWPQPIVEGAHAWFGRPIDEFLDHFDPGSTGA
jgi:acetyltransferase-like isoleucine patch superfamily enzyme